MCAHFEAVSHIVVHPKELEHAERLRTEKRRREFLAGRRLVKVALGDIGPILPSEKRVPLFPNGIHASLSHSEGYVGLLHATEQPLGLDIQMERSVSRGFQQRVCASKEEHKMAPVNVFSAKEAAYKALSPWHDFIFFPRFIELREIDGGTFSVLKIRGEQPLKPVLISQFTIPDVVDGRACIISVAGVPNNTDCYRG